MKRYETLALKELLAQRVTSMLILLAIVLSTLMTAVIGQSMGVLSAMRQQQAIAIGGNRHAGFTQMNQVQLEALEQDPRLSYVGVMVVLDRERRKPPWSSPCPRMCWGIWVFRESWEIP